MTKHTNTYTSQPAHFTTRTADRFEVAPTSHYELVVLLKFKQKHVGFGRLRSKRYHELHLRLDAVFYNIFKETHMSIYMPLDSEV